MQIYLLPQSPIWFKNPEKRQKIVGFLVEENEEFKSQREGLQCYKGLTTEGEKIRDKQM